MIKQLATAATILAAMVVSADAQVTRLEVYPVSSVTLKDSDFLAGRQDGQPVTIAGELRIPKVTTSCPPSYFSTARAGLAAVEA